MGSTKGRRVHSIEKSIQLLDCFWAVRRPLSLRELEQMTGWAKSTIHGLLASMLDSAVVEQNASDGKYRLGYHLFELGSAVSQGWNVPEVCKPHLQRLVDRLGESVHLARLSGDELILVECEAPHTGFRVTSESGAVCPSTAPPRARPSWRTGRKMSWRACYGGSLPYAPAPATPSPSRNACWSNWR